MTNMDDRAMGVLFDFDGVLVNSMPTHLKAWQVAYQTLFQTELEPKELNHLIGRSTAYIADYLCRKQHCSWRANELTEIKATRILDYLPEVELLPGSQSFCEYLLATSIPFGIVSNAPKTFILQTLRQCQLEVPFFFGMEDYKRAKPHPDPYIMGARKLQIDFSQYHRILTFEDSTHGLTAACKAFTTAIGITSQHPPEILLQAGASRTYPNLAEAFDAGILECSLPKPLR